MPSPADYHVAIPSRSRVECLADKTLPLLAARNIDPERVTVFVAPAELDAYRAALPDVRIAAGGTDLPGQRNAIATAYPEGEYVVSIDDDVTDVVQFVGGKKLEPLPNLHSFFKEAFDTCARLNLGLWGVYPVANAFYMKHAVTTDLRFIIGTLHGFVSRHDDAGRVSLPCKADYELSIKRFLAEGGVVRFSYVSMKSRTYKEPGGLQGIRTPAMADHAARALIDRYPQFVRLNPRRKSGHTEILIRS